MTVSRVQISIFLVEFLFLSEKNLKDFFFNREFYKTYLKLVFQFCHFPSTEGLSESWFKSMWYWHLEGMFTEQRNAEHNLPTDLKSSLNIYQR